MDCSSHLERVTIGVLDAGNVLKNVLAHRLVGDDARAQLHFLRIWTKRRGVG